MPVFTQRFGPLFNVIALGTVTPGVYSGSSAVTGGADGNASDMLVTGSFTVQVGTINGSSVTIYPNGIVNAASYAGGGISPGEIATIFGSGLGPSTLVSLQLDSRGFVSTSLGGTQVLFDGVAAPMIYAEAGQVSAVVPYSVTGKGSTQVQVSYQGQFSSLVTEPVAVALPGVFTIDSSGRGPGAILNQDLTVNSASNPASVGSYISVYATGEGQTNPTGVDGKPAGFPPPTPVAQPVTANIGGINEYVVYAGGAPGLVAGVLQVSIPIPQGVTPRNSTPIVIAVAGKSSQANVTVAVK